LLWKLTLHPYCTFLEDIIEPFTDSLLGSPVILESPVRWFLEYKNQMRSAGSTRQVRNLVLVVKWSKNHATGIPSKQQIRVGLYMSCPLVSQQDVPIFDCRYPQGDNYGGDGNPNHECAQRPMRRGGCLRQGISGRVKVVGN